MIRTIFSLILVAVLAAPTTGNAAVRKRRARAQSTAQAGKGKIVGHVIDAKGRPLGRARIHVHRLRRPGVHPRLRAGGSFGTRALPPGMYLVSASNRAVGRGKAAAMVVAGKATTVTVRIHKRHGHHAHQKHALGVVIREKKLLKETTPKPAPTSTPKSVAVPNKVK